MPRTRDSYRVTGSSAQEIVTSLNFLLQRIADRLDKIEGIRGTSSIESDLLMNENVITEVGSGSDDADAARLADLNSDIDSAIDAHEALSDPHAQYAQNAGAEIIIGAWQFKTPVRVYDANDTLIHSMESDA